MPTDLAAKAAYQHKWYQANKERVNAERRAKYGKDPDRPARAAARRESNRKHAAKMKAQYREIVDSVKDRPCQDCGGTFPPECMDFDHVRGEKLFGIGDMGYRPIASVLAEIAKCDLICANCHRTRTRKGRQHGYGKKPATLLHAHSSGLCSL